MTDPKTISPAAAAALVENGALLVDIREVQPSGNRASSPTPPTRRCRRSRRAKFRPPPVSR